MPGSIGDSRLAGYWDESAFSVGDVEYRRIDVALGAMARGDWALFEQRLAEGLACVTRAARDDASPSADELDAAATAFRYDRDLIASEEITGWLGRVLLTIDDWTSFLERDLLRERWRASLEDTLDRHPPSAHQLEMAAFAEGVCSGLFDQFDASFAGRAALVVQQGPVPDRIAPSSDRGETAATLLRTHARWLSCRSPEDARARVDRVLSIESRFDGIVANMVTPTALAEVIDRNPLEWQPIELDTLTFATEHAAREAVLCVTVDRLSLHDVAALSHGSVDRRTCFPDELDPDVRDRLIAVDPAGVLGPIPINGHFGVLSVVRRGAPAPSEPRVLERSRQTVIDTAIRRAARNHVTRP